MDFEKMLKEVIDYMANIRDDRDRREEYLALNDIYNALWKLLDSQGKQSYSVLTKNELGLLIEIQDKLWKIVKLKN